MKKYLRKLTKTQFLLLCFIPFGAGSFYFNGWPGLFGAIIGWWLGGVLWRNQKAILNYNYKKFFRKYRVALTNLLILIVLDIIVYHISDWSTFLAVTVGWLLGMIVWRWRKGRW